MIKPKEAYPLQWPVGYKRMKNRSWSKFKQTPDNAQIFLRDELFRLGATNIVVSSNVPIRQDGRMYANAMRLANQQENDPGVAVYFDYKEKAVVLCCDTYLKVWENVYAIGKTVENLRAIDRYGVSDFLSRSFTGFAELPESIHPPYTQRWWEVLGVGERATSDEIIKAFRTKALIEHPDKGGSHEGFTKLKNAYEEGLKNSK